MKVLVTGAAGFIGMHLAEALLNAGHEVVGYDNLNDYYAVSLKRDRYSHLTDIEGFTAMQGDLCDQATLNALFDDHNFDVVCNLAAQAGVRYSLTHPEAYMNSNLVGFLNILEACRHHNTPRLVYASSSSVYGGTTKLPSGEDDPVDHPISLYAATKKSNELMAHTYTHLFGLQTIGLRFFTVYGPWGRPDMAMWLFTEAMLNNRPIKVFNHGNMRRDFTYVDDIVQGVKACIEGEGLDPYELFNIGNGHPENLMDMIQCLAGELGVTPQMEMLPMQPGDVPVNHADVSRIHAKLGYQPTTPIQMGIPRFAAWYREYHEMQEKSTS